MANHAVGQDTVVGQTLGHYRIVEKIGAGGMGEVYRARDEHLARDVAIKVLPPDTLPDESARKHFHKEALILSQLNHPNVATIHDFDTQQGMDFLVMEYIPGITLREKVAAGPLPEKDVLRLSVQLAEGLAAAHDHGVIHRDLKPRNLRITSDGRLKILDFGLAKVRLPVTASAATESSSEMQAMAGTLPYMAPEQLLGAEKSGKPCRAAATAGGLCFFHANPNKAAELGRIGGRNKSRLPAEAPDPLPKLDKVSSLRDAVEKLIADVYVGKLAPRVAAGVAPLLNLQFRVLEATDLEQRLAKVEKLLAANGPSNLGGAPGGDRGVPPSSDGTAEQ